MDSFVPKSSFLEKAEYSESDKTMTLTFKTGGQYKYLYIFPATWSTFKQSPDHSSYYSRVIKGRMQAVAIQTHKIGKKPKSPLNQPKQNKGLELKHGKSIINAGIRQTYGTVNRAFNPERKGTNTEPLK